MKTFNLNKKNAGTLLLAGLAAVSLFAGIQLGTVITASAQSEAAIQVSTSEEFVNALNNYDEISLSDDITLNVSYSRTIIDNSVTINVNGHTLTLTEENAYGFVVNSGATVEVVGEGAIVCANTAFYAQGGTVRLGDGVNNLEVTTTSTDYCMYVMYGSEVYVNSNATVKNDSETYVAFVYYNSKLTVAGTISTEKGCAITTNGSDPRACTITIQNGARIYSEKEVAIYLPSGILNIEGGTIEGSTGIYMRGGTLNVTGGSAYIHANGAQSSNPNSTGAAYNTGDALIIVYSGTSYPTLSVSISAGRFESDNGNSVLLTQVTNASGTNPISRFITYGDFNTDVTDYVVEGVSVIEASGWWFVG